MKDDSINSVLPEQLITRLVKIWPDDHSWEAFSHPFSTVFRINTLTTTAEQCLAECEKLGLSPTPLDYLPDTFCVPTEQRGLLTNSKLIDQGWIYIQNPSSILAALLVGAQPGEQVLDLTAAPGGKTLVLAQTMANQGRLAAVEASKSRFFKLKANLDRCKVTIAKLYLKDGRRVGQQVPARFDRVLLDAPCSAEAEIKSYEPASFANWSVKKVKRLHAKQFQLLESAYCALKPGGTLVYCTCTFAPEENEAVVSALINRHDDIALESIAAPGFRTQAGIEAWEGTEFCADIDRCLRILPDQTHKGFFIAKMHKLG